jgi:hypothetical protein
VAEHIAQMSMRAGAFFGHQQRYLFDDAWAANPVRLSAAPAALVSHQAGLARTGAGM